MTTATLRPFTSTDHAYVYETNEDEHSVDEDLKEDKLERTPIGKRSVSVYRILGGRGR